MIDLSIIIINYNTFETTCNCLKSFFQYKPDCVFEVILVDNASTECDSENFLDIFPNIKLVKSKINLGFAGGNNLGLKYANGTFILLLNSDTVFIEDCITPCIEFMNLNPKVGVVNPKLLNPDFTYQKNARRFKNIKNELVDFFRPIIRLFPYKLYSKYFLNQYFKGDYNVQCDWVSGAFFFTKREMIMKFSDEKFDDRFFMYGEDVLWCYQIAQLDFTCDFLSKNQIIHIGNASNDKRSSKLNKLIIDREFWFYKHRGNHILGSFVFKLILILKVSLDDFYKVILGIKMRLKKS